MRRVGVFLLLLLMNPVGHLETYGFYIASFEFESQTFQQDVMTDGIVAFTTRSLKKCRLDLDWDSLTR